MNDSYLFLLKRLDKFIRKFYINNLVKGIIYTAAIIFATFLAIVLSESQWYFSPLVRKVLFSIFIFISIGSLFHFVVKPILHLYKLGDILSYEQAANIIGKHFANVQDKLINILQLKNASISLQNAALIDASINQKINDIKTVPFLSAIELNENKKYLKYALPPLFLFFILLVIRPHLITDSTNRLIKNNIVFEKPSPFSFNINADSLIVTQYEDFVLDITLDGDELPSEVFLIQNGIKHITQKVNSNTFQYVFSNLQDSKKFYLEGAGYTSNEYFLEVLPKPIINSFEVKINYPNYIGLKDKILLNTGDIEVPEGSHLTWIFDVIGVDKISMQFSDALIYKNLEKNKPFIFDKTFKKNDKYIIKIFNFKSNKIDSSAFNIIVFPDAYPQIDVQEYQDSTNNDVQFYIGSISDDYGLNKLNLVYTIKNNEGKVNTKVIAIPFEKGIASDFSYYWNIKEIGVESGDELSYYFEVWDNDQINGNKSTKSKLLSYKVPSIEEMKKESDKSLQSIKKDLKDAMSKSKDIQESLKEMQEDFKQKEELSWKDKQKTQEIIQKQKQLEKQIKNIQEELSKNIEEQEKFKKVDPEIKKKQEQLKDLFDEVLTEEMKEMIHKLEKMMEDLAKDQMQLEMNEMQVSDEDLEKELDRMLELLKKLEEEQKMTEAIKKLEDLAEKQDKLADDNRSKKLEEQKITEEQKKLNKEFDEVKKDIESLEELNNIGKEDIKDLEEKAEDIDFEMQDALDKMQDSEMQKAGNTQKQISKKMEQMAQQMQKMMGDMQQQALEVNMESLRQLLENLILLSFEEERIFNEIKTVEINTPYYVELVQDQFKLIDDSKLVEDSLYALAKRVFELERFITDEIKSVNKNLEKAVKKLEDRNISKAIVDQQYVMTSYNNLALMLDETLQSMQQQMAEQMQGNQMCENPGNNPGSKLGKKPGKIPSLKHLQNQLNDQISQMSEMMKKGSSSSKNGEQSKKLAEMAAKQQMIRQKLQEINQGDNKDGKGSLGDLQKIMEEMDKTETDIVNKRITQELLNRQQDIMTRLLEAENAERERDQKEEREAVAAKQVERKTPPSLAEFIKQKQGSLDLYKNIPPRMNPYYRSVSEKYIKNVFEN